MHRLGEYVIRHAQRLDIPKVISINFSTLPEHYSEYFYEDLMQESPKTFLVAEKDREVVGYIMCRVEYGFSNLKRFSLGKKGHIVSVAILEGHRRKGLGRELIQKALEGLRENDCAEAFLEVRVSNVPAIRLYEELGFNKCSTINDYYRDGEAAYSMAISLLKPN